MGETKELNTKKKAHYYDDDMINIINFNSNLLKIHKKPYKGFNMYYIGDITIKKYHKFSDHKNIQILCI